MTRAIFLAAALLLLQANFLQAAESDESSDSELYYAVDRPFGSGNWETQLSAGYDFSNPYLHRYSGTIGTYWIATPYFATGIEFAGFTTDMRSGARALEQQLSAYAFSLSTLAPKANAVAVARLTPLSGIVNLFGTKLVKADLSILARAGGLYYEALPLGVLVGTGLEVNLGFTPNWGVHLALLWDGEKPPSRAWESKVGFRAGPTLRF